MQARHIRNMSDTRNRKLNQSPSDTMNLFGDQFINPKFVNPNYLYGTRFGTRGVASPSPKKPVQKDFFSALMQNYGQAGNQKGKVPARKKRAPQSNQPRVGLASEEFLVQRRERNRPNQIVLTNEKSEVVEDLLKHLDK